MASKQFPFCVYKMSVTTPVTRINLHISQVLVHCQTPLFLPHRAVYKDSCHLKDFL